MNDLLNSLISRRMVMDVLKGQISTSKDVRAWLDSHATEPISELQG